MPQSLAKVYLHIIFSTKHRQAMLDESWRPELFSVMGGCANHLKCQSLIVGGVEDHIHILLQLARSISIAEAVSKIKSTSSLWINQHHPMPTSFHWQNGYSAFSVSQSNVAAVRTYIANQVEHHAYHSFEDELRTWLQRYEIEWNEEYLWD